MAKIVIDKNRIFLIEDSNIFREKFFGKPIGNKLELSVEECLYLMEMRNVDVYYNDSKLSFSEIASKFINSNKKLFVRYNTFRDWRDRGLFIKPFEMKNFGNIEKVSYPSKPIKIQKIEIKLNFFPTDLISLVDDGRKYSYLFEDYWFGQLGVYKNHVRGKTLKFDLFETIFLKRHFGAKVINIENNEELNEEEIFNFTNNSETFKVLYDVYEDWRLRGFVVKTGYKFGCHFRIYFPGVSPTKSSKEWIHSKHVLHVFPKFERMMISEWSRAIRVAHSVRKTFIMSVPGIKENEFINMDLDFLAFYRDKNNKVITPDNKPNFVVWSLGEDEYIGGYDLGSALRIAENVGLDLILAINGRESDLTYYIAKKIDLPGSKYNYYEIRWFQP